jgi:hypothetical protein
MERHRGDEVARLFNQVVLDQHLVLGGDNLADRGKIPGAAAGGRSESDLAPDHSEDHTEERCGDQKGRLILLTEKGKGDTDEQPQPQSGKSAGDRYVAVSQTPRDAFDGLQLSTDDNHVLDWELVVGQVVDDVLCLVVFVVTTKRPRVLKVQCKAWKRSWCCHCLASFRLGVRCSPGRPGRNRTYKGSSSNGSLFRQRPQSGVRMGARRSVVAMAARLPALRRPTGGHYAAVLQQLRPTRLE